MVNQLQEIEVSNEMNFWNQRVSFAMMLCLEPPTRYPWLMENSMDNCSVATAACFFSGRRRHTLVYHLTGFLALREIAPIKSQQAYSTHIVVAALLHIRLPYRFQYEHLRIADALRTTSTLPPRAADFTKNKRSGVAASLFISNHLKKLFVMEHSKIIIQ